jgi:acid phosphatase
MATLQPRPPYSPEELKALYPTGLELQLVQVLLRHGERSPVSARFQNAGLAPFVGFVFSSSSKFPSEGLPQNDL